MLDIVALVLNILSSLFLIVFILLHSGKGSGLSPETRARRIAKYVDMLAAGDRPYS